MRPWASALYKLAWERRNTGSKLSDGTEATGAGAHSAASVSSNKVSPQRGRQLRNRSRNQTSAPVRSPTRCVAYVPSPAGPVGPWATVFYCRWPWWWPNARGRRAQEKIIERLGTAGFALPGTILERSI